MNYFKIVTLVLVMFALSFLNLMFRCVAAEEEDGTDMTRLRSSCPFFVGMTDKSWHYIRKWWKEFLVK